MTRLHNLWSACVEAGCVKCNTLTLRACIRLMAAVSYQLNDMEDFTDI